MGKPLPEQHEITELLAQGELRKQTALDILPTSLLRKLLMKDWNLARAWLYQQLGGAG